MITSTAGLPPAHAKTPRPEVPVHPLGVFGSWRENYFPPAATPVAGGIPNQPLAFRPAPNSSNSLAGRHPPRGGWLGRGGCGYDQKRPPGGPSPGGVSGNRRTAAQTIPTTGNAGQGSRSGWGRQTKWMASEYSAPLGPPPWVLFRVLSHCSPMKSCGATTILL